MQAFAGCIITIDAAVRRKSGSGDYVLALSLYEDGGGISSEGIRQCSDSSMRGALRTATTSKICRTLLTLSRRRWLSVAGGDDGYLRR